MEIISSNYNKENNPSEEKDVYDSPNEKVETFDEQMIKEDLMVNG